MRRADLLPLGACFCAPARARSGRYQKRKYVWKMLYIYVLGYEVDFGHMEALNLITTQGYAEKTVGYLACVLLLSETNEFLRLVINSVKNDLNSHNDEIQVRSPVRDLRDSLLVVICPRTILASPCRLSLVHARLSQSLALACVANVGGREFAETLAPGLPVAWRCRPAELALVRGAAASADVPRLGTGTQVRKPCCAMPPLA